MQAAARKIRLPPPIHPRADTHEINTSGHNAYWNLPPKFVSFDTSTNAAAKTMSGIKNAAAIRGSFIGSETQHECKQERPAKSEEDCLATPKTSPSVKALRLSYKTDWAMDNRSSSNATGNKRRLTAGRSPQRLALSSSMRASL